MKQLLLLLTFVLASCEDTVTFKYHIQGKYTQRIGEFPRGLIVGDSTVITLYHNTYGVVLDSLIPDK